MQVHALLHDHIWMRLLGEPIRVGTSNAQLQNS